MCVTQLGTVEVFSSLVVAHQECTCATLECSGAPCMVDTVTFGRPNRAQEEVSLVRRTQVWAPIAVQRGRQCDDLADLSKQQDGAGVSSN